MDAGVRGAEDIVAGFTVNEDQIGTDISDLESTAGVADQVLGATATSLVLVPDNWRHGDGHRCTANLLIVSGDFTNAQLSTALENGGARALTLNGQFDDNDFFLAAYDDGTNSTSP